MGVPTLEVGYTSATTGRGDHEVHKGQVVALGGGGFSGKTSSPILSLDVWTEYYDCIGPATGPIFRPVSLRFLFTTFIFTL
jgi:hypothetical protein